MIDRSITLSVANSRRSTRWIPTTIKWSEFIKKIEIPTRGKETLDEYLRLPKAKQDDLKDIGGYVGGSLKGLRRKAGEVTGRDIITLDLDHIPAKGTKDIVAKVAKLGCTYLIYSTRKHEPNAPRLRVVLLLDRTVTADEYEPIARKAASVIGMEYCDPTTFEVSRLMYFPSVCKDAEYVFEHGEKELLCADGILGMYKDWRNMDEWARVPGAELAEKKRSLNAIQQDPTTKGGWIGAFNKAYTITEAINTFLQGSYVPCDMADDRYTYAVGSTTGGAVIYDDKFLYSHHATDPAGGILCNAFDLVRIHRFGDLDVDPELTGTAQVSFKKMVELAQEDEKVKTVLAKEQIERIGEDFGDDMSWLNRLDKKQSGEPKATIDNIQIILNNDPNLKGKFAYDEFTEVCSVLAPLPWNKSETVRYWSNTDDAGLRSYIEKTYRISAMQKVYDAFALHIEQNKINSVKNYLNSLSWDGTPRLETMLIDYLGAEDTPYNRAVTKMCFTAAVARALRPGVKFDNVLILVGKQGIGKSTLLRVMGREWFSDSLLSFEGRDAQEHLIGKWLIELGELATLSKSEMAIAKQFLSKTEDNFRAAYARRSESHLRKCVFFGTTNEAEFLRDSTGNRRFLPVTLGAREPTKNVFEDLENEVSQLWAEAKTLYENGEKLYLPKNLEAVAREVQEDYREVDAREGLILEFIEREVPADWGEYSLQQRRAFWSEDFEGKGELVPRDKICAMEIWCECLGKKQSEYEPFKARQINQVLSHLEGWAKVKNVNSKVYGQQRGYRRL